MNKLAFVFIMVAFTAVVLALGYCSRATVSSNKGEQAMNNQEAFNIMVQHLRKQGRKSELDASNCAYRSKDGLKCAVGALISDEKYQKKYEGHSASMLAQLTGMFKGLDLYLLDDVQNIHDNYPVTAWESRLKGVAEDYELTLPEDKR
jgi:hypothetical protein